MTLNHWDGDEFITTGTIVDGTSVGGTSLGQSGYVEIVSVTNDTVAPYLVGGYYLYFYQMFVDVEASATITNITLNADMQDAVDIWDGEFRTPIYFFTDVAGVKQIFTAEVIAESNQLGDYVCTLDHGVKGSLSPMDNGDEMIIVFEEPMAGLKIEMWGTDVNSEVNTIEVAYRRVSGTWSAGTAVVRDSTIDDAGRTKTLNKADIYNLMQFPILELLQKARRPLMDTRDMLINLQSVPGQ